jgi:crAss001_48 related protein
MGEVNELLKKIAAGVTKIYLRKEGEPMDAYQQRVIAECANLEAQTGKLAAFIGSNSIFKELSQEQQFLMRLQHTVMGMYCDILHERIKLFTKS